jgi:hypothetical protein
MLQEAVRRIFGRSLVPTVLVLLLSSSAGIAQTPQHPLTPAQVRAKIAAARALPDDAVSAIHRLLALPPATQSAGQFMAMPPQSALLPKPHLPWCARPIAL